MKTIDNDIKRQEFKKVYLLYGEERYLIRQYRDKLKKALSNPDDTMNFTSFEGEDINVKEVIDLAETLPFFADRRVIFLEDSKLFKKGGDELGEYLAELPDSTYLVFVEEEINAFVPEEYWTLDGKFVLPSRKVLTAAFYGDETGKVELKTQEQTDSYISRLEKKIINELREQMTHA